MIVKIKEVAKKRGYTLYAVANALGMPQQTVYSWAKGRTQPNWQNIELLCMFLNCGIADLFIPEKLNPVQLRARKIYSYRPKSKPFWESINSETKAVSDIATTEGTTEQ